MTHDVAIVGAGPVGTALAVLLAQLGRSVLLLERRPEPYALPRAVHFDDEVGRILQACGLGDRLRAISEPAEVYEWRNATGSTLLRFGRIGLGPCGWPQSSMFNQPAMEQLLTDRAAGLSAVELRRDVEVTDLAQGRSTVELSGMDRRTGEPMHTSARYVVGCDGANSTVRSLIEAPVQDLGFFHDWLIVDVVLHEPRIFDPINVQICDPARPSTAVSGGPGRRRWEFMRLPDESLAELDSEAAAWRLLESWDVTPANATLERRAVYTFQARWVQRWRQGRVLLAGDAAHQMPPFAGQGLCAGLRDVNNLAWKLDLVVDGRADQALLDTYESERCENVQRVIDFSMELGKVICVPDPVEASARDDAMIAGIVVGELTEVPPLPGISTGLISAGSPHAGTVLPQGRVAGRVRLDDEVGVGWRLVMTPSTASELRALLRAEAALATWFARIGGRALSIGTDGDLSDPDGTYLEWFDAHDASAALQRPDFHLYGTALDGRSALELLVELRGSLDTSP